MKTKITFRKAVLALAFVLAATSGAWAQKMWAGGTVTLSEGDDVTVNVILTGNVTINVPSGTAAVSGRISGNYGIKKTGNGTLYFTNDNTYTGTTTIDAGAVVLGRSTPNGSITSNVVVNKDAYFTFSRSNEYTYSGIISGAGDVYKTGSSKTILTGANTFTGGAVVWQGILQIGDGVSTTVSINSASLAYVSADAVLRFEPGKAMVFSKAINGDGRVEKGSTYTLAFTAENTYSGTTTVEAGELWLGNNTPAGSVAGNIVLNKDAHAVFSRTTDYTYQGIISGSGSIYQNSLTGALTLNGVNTYTGYTVTYGTLILGIGGSVESSEQVILSSDSPKLDITSGNKKIKNLNSINPKSLVFLGTNTLSVNDNADNIFSGIFTGSGNITKIGSGKFTLSSANTATGTFTQSAGEVVFSDGAIWAGSYDKADRTSLTVQGNASIGKNLTLAGGAINMDLSAAKPSKISVANAVSASGTNTFNVTMGTANNYVLMEVFSGISDTTPYSLKMSSGDAYLSVTGKQLTLTKENETYSNLYAAVQGEINANAAYNAYATQANVEGHTFIAQLFRATADAEEKHANDEWAILLSLGKTKTAKPIAATRKVGTTTENLQMAIDGEMYEYTVMYYYFKETADKEGMTDASRIFNYAMKAEQTFAGNYSDVLDKLRNGNISSIASIYAVLYRCPVCGEIVTTHPIICPICGTNGDTFVKYDMNLSGIDNPQQAKAFKVYVRNKILYVSELIAGDLLNVYNATGTLIYCRPVTSNEAIIPLPAKGVYIVRSGKVIMKVIN